jgi:hypothetical protein
VAGADSPLRQDGVFLGVLMPCAVNVRGTFSGNGAFKQQPEDQSPQHAEVSTPHAQHHGESQAKETPAWRQVAELLLCWGVFAMFTLLLSHYQRCSPEYWTIFAGQTAACIGAGALFIYLVSLPPPLDYCHCCFSKRRNNLDGENGAIGSLHWSLGSMSDSH